MLHAILNDDPWFHPKRYGYGAGLPCAWQGWVTLGAYLAVVLGCALLFTDAPWVPPLVIVPATVVLILIARRHTRGGWRWRSGKD